MAPEADRTRRSPVRALIRTAALRSNAEAAAAAAGARAWADARRDAWGHGAAATVPVLLAAGLGVVVDAAVHRALASTAPAGSLRCEEPVETVPAAAIWGLPGADAAPVMSLRGIVLAVKPLRAGEGVSYGYAFRADRDTRVALVAGGYAQGVVRELAGRAQVHIGGVRAPILGRVAMDACVVDVADGEVATGDEAVFFGDPALSEPALADWAGVGVQAEEIVALAGLRGVREVVA